MIYSNNRVKSIAQELFSKKSCRSYSHVLHCYHSRHPWINKTLQPEMPKMNFSERLREVMLEKRPVLTQSALAELVGVSQSAVTTWLYGGHSPYEKHVQKICLALGIRRDWLMYGEGEKYLRTDVILETPASTDYGTARTDKARRVEKNVRAILENADTQTFELFEGVVQPFARQVIAHFKREAEPGKKPVRIAIKFEPSEESKHPARGVGPKGTYHSKSSGGKSHRSEDDPK